MKQNAGWKFAGYHEVPLQYYPRRHEMMRFAGKPFLEISVQGASGTGVASEIAEWFDLTLPVFEPVFSFPVQGQRHMTDLDISRGVSGYAPQHQVGSVETIHLGLSVRFSFDGNDLGELTTPAAARCRPTRQPSQKPTSDTAAMRHTAKIAQTIEATPMAATVRRRFSSLLEPARCGRSPPLRPVACAALASNPVNRCVDGRG